MWRPPAHASSCRALFGLSLMAMSSCSWPYFSFPGHCEYETIQDGSHLGWKDVSVASSDDQACGIQDSALRCWSSEGEFDPPVSGATAVDGSCALDSASYVRCWNAKGELRDQEELLSLGPALDLADGTSRGGEARCVVLAADGSVVCWAQQEQEEPVFPDSYNAWPKVAGGYSEVTVGTGFACAVEGGTGAIRCVGDSDKLPLSRTDDGKTYSSLQADDSMVCAIYGAGQVQCWEAGTGSSDVAIPPDSAKVVVPSPGGGNCYVTDAGGLSCDATVSHWFDHGCFAAAFDDMKLQDAAGGWNNDLVCGIGADGDVRCATFLASESVPFPPP